MADFFGTSGGETIVGSNEDDLIVGDGGNDILKGLGGHDMIYGSLGNDRLYGGDGADYLKGGPGVDYYDGGSDAGVPTLGDPAAGGIGDRVTFYETRATSNVIVDLRSRLVSDDGFGNRETIVNVESIGGGTAFADRFYGNDKANYISGEVGDSVFGFGGSDILGCIGAVFVDGGTGVDRFKHVDAKHLIPDRNADGFADLSAAMAKGIVVDLSTGTIVDSWDNISTIKNVEIVEGSTLDDLLTGDALGNELAGLGGNDRLDGRAGNDLLDGGEGTDTASYASADAGVKVSLAAATAQDTLAAGTDRLVNIENLIGSAHTDSLTGSSAGNLLDGGPGPDTMNGGRGHDTYVVDDSGDRVVESESTGGTDSVRSSLSYSLGANLEHLILVGTGSINGTGNGRANNITGNSGANLLAGGGGSDSLRGGSGNDKLSAGTGSDHLFGGAGNDILKGDDSPSDRQADHFYFDSRPNSLSSHDTIVDFNPADDMLHLARSVFSRISEAGPLSASAFRAGTQAVDASDRIIYDKATGNIFYDADGTGSAAAILFATVTPGTTLTNADFVVYS